MAIAYRSTGTAYANAGNVTRTPGLPSGTAQDDLLIYCTAVSDPDATIPVASGYTSFLLHQSATSQSLRIEYKIAGSSESAPSYSAITGNASTGTVICQGVAISGVDTTTPFDVTGTVFEAASQANIGAITGITPSFADFAVVVVGMRTDDWTSVATLTGDSLTWTEIGEPDSTTGTDAGLVWNIGIRSGAAAAVTDKTFTVTGGAANTVKGVMFSLKPFVAGTPTSLPNVIFERYTPRRRTLQRM